jgi:hypothetical protein
VVGRVEMNNISQKGNPIQTNVSIFLKKLKIPEWMFLLAISMVLGLACFLILYGRFSLYFTNVNWIYAKGGDNLQHQLGWEFFRQEPWQFPLGKITSYGYPIGSSVSYLDSIPLFAFFFKLIAVWLPDRFQYIGLWELTSVIGQLFVTILFLREFTKSWPKMILGGLLVELAAPRIFRSFGHSSLGAQWLILLGILLVILEYRHKLWRWSWPFLFLLAMLVHLYFVPMLLVLWGIGMYFRYRGKKNKWQILFDLLVIAAVIYGSGYCLGLFQLSFSDLASTGAKTDFSWNMNQFFNSMGYSKILKALPLLDNTQEEGFSYLGLGYFFIIAVAIVLFFILEPGRRKWQLYLPFLIASIVFVIVSCKSTGTFGSFIVWNVHLPDSVESFIRLFRSSGRFIWPVFYFVILFSILMVIRNSKIAIPILIIGILLQFFDLQPLIESRKVAELTGYTSGGMKESIWKPIGQTNKHIDIIPTEYYAHLVVFAAHHEMTINSGYFGRADYMGMENDAYDIWDGLLSGKSEKDTIYVLSQDKFVAQAKADLSDRMYVCYVDGYNVLFSADNLLTKTDFDFNSYCSIPAQ